MRIEKEGEDVSAPPRHLVFAYYVTGHGFGHATRVVEVYFSLFLPISVSNVGGYLFQFCF